MRCHNLRRISPRVQANSPRVISFIERRKNFHLSFLKTRTLIKTQQFIIRMNEMSGHRKSFSPRLSPLFKGPLSSGGTFPRIIGASVA